MTVPAAHAFQSAFQVSAHNVANAVTPGFEPSRVIFQAGPTGQVRAHVDHPRHRPQDEGELPGDLPPSGTDLAGEMVEMTHLQRTYTATLKATQTRYDSLGVLLDILA